MRTKPTKGEKKVRKVYGWGHLALTSNKVFAVFIQREKPYCPHGEDWGLDCMIPVTISYSVPTNITKRK